MVATEVLHVSAEAFFNEIVRSIVSDIQRQSGKKMHASQIKPGLHYKKKLNDRFSSNAEVSIKVLECMPNKLYASSFSSNLDVTTTKYEIEEIAQEQIKVTYTEEYTLLQKKESKAQKLFGSKFLEKSSDKKGKKLLKHIEEYILQQSEKQKG